MGFASQHDMTHIIDDANSPVTTGFARAVENGGGNRGRSAKRSPVPPQALPGDEPLPRSPASILKEASATASAALSDKKE
jgi:hypothetical protein